MTLSGNAGAFAPLQPPKRNARQPGAIVLVRRGAVSLANPNPEDRRSCTRRSA